MSDKEDKYRLSEVAIGIQTELLLRLRGRIVPRKRLVLKVSYTQGWRIELASMRSGGPRLEVWLDRWTGKRRFWYGFYSVHAESMRRKVDKLPDYLQPHRHFSETDMQQVGKADWVLNVPLKQNEFNHPLYEEYNQRYSYFGMFDPTEPGSKADQNLIAQRAFSFFDDVIQGRDRHDDICNKKADGNEYPHIENRRVVRKHLARERSSALAEECKIRDHYTCRVCATSFEKLYGKIGKYFAEAHHVIPLSRLDKLVRSSLSDLITVCSNCHRMLHRLDGESGDLKRLQRMMLWPR